MGNSATGGCCCCGCDVTPDAPENIIPDPENGQPCTFTVQRCGWSGMSRDYQAFRGPDEPVEENRWLFLNKSGSTWGGECKIAVENFIRENPDNPKLGQILWEADFIDSPYFQQYLRDPMASGMELMMNEMFGGGFGGFMGGGGMWQSDDHYMHRGSWDRDYMCSLYINWTLNTHAILNTETRQGYGCALKLGVFACGTAVARYFEVEEAIEETDDDGNTRIVGYRTHWEHHTHEYVDSVQFSLVTAEAGPTWQAGQLLALPDGSPAVWSLPGDASDWTNNYATPYFTVQQEGGWFTKDPARIHTPPCLDPALCLLIGHLATTEFSSAGIKEALHPDFPVDPRSGIMFGMLNRAPPPVIQVQQPYQVQYQGNMSQFQSVPVPGYGAPQPQMMMQPGMVPQQPMAQAVPMAQPMAQAVPMAQPVAQPGYGANYAEDGADDVHAKLAKLKKMMDDGLIDADDYERKKDQLLDKI